jgi:cyclopropane-fatty-acyl-phospholipid synthase
MSRARASDRSPQFFAPANSPDFFQAALMRVVKRIKYGRLTLQLTNGRTITATGSSDAGPHAMLRLIRPRAARRLFIGGAIGFAEAYMDGDWDTPDLPGLLAFAGRNEQALEKAVSGLAISRLINRLIHLMRPNTREGSRRNIARHYDLSNAFYRLWLDRSMTYSSALFRSPADSLEQAQLNKYEQIASSLDLKSEHHILEIGCGWGGFAEYVARRYGCRVTGITVSREQAVFARARMAAAGLADRVDIRLEDYRDVQGSFDRIVSIEMFEAVGEAYWPVYFGVVRDRLRASGIAAVQIITIAEERFEQYRSGADFIQRFIFPGGMLPSSSALAATIGRVGGLHMAGRDAFAPSYARTLALWRDRFHAAWPSIEGLGFDRRFRRMWDYYLAYCEAGFRHGTLDVVQLRLVRSGAGGGG